MYKNTFVDRVSLNINIVSNRVARHSSYAHAVDNISDHSHETAYHAKMLKSFRRVSVHFERRMSSDDRAVSSRYVDFYCSTLG